MMIEFNSILTGDCAEILKDLPDSCIGACITDPPYNYEFVGRDWNHAEIARRIQRVQDSNTLVKHLPYGSGLSGGVRNQRWYERHKVNNREYQSWVANWGSEVCRVCKPGAVMAVFSSTRTVAHVQVGLEDAGFYARDCIVYRHPSGIPKGINMAAKLRQKGIDQADEWEGWHSCLRNEWDAILVMQKPLSNNYMETVMKYGVGLFHTEGDSGFQSNIIDYVGRDPVQDEKNAHCTPKPLKLMEKLVHLFVPNRADAVVLDPFAGSGTTLLAAQNLGRTYLGIEINTEYTEKALQRLAQCNNGNSTIAESETPLLF